MSKYNFNEGLGKEEILICIANEIAEVNRLTRVAMRKNFGAQEDKA